MHPEATVYFGWEAKPAVVVIGMQTTASTAQNFK